MKRTLILYYSHSNGNTKSLAEDLQKATGGDLAAIETEKPHTGSYDEIVKEAQDEIKKEYVRPVKPLSYNIGDYDVIAVGTPTWWYTMAPAVKTVLSQHDFTGRTVIPFMTHAGWPGHTLRDMAAACKNAAIAAAKKIRFDGSGGPLSLRLDRRSTRGWKKCGKSYYRKKALHLSSLQYNTR